MVMKQLKNGFDSAIKCLLRLTSVCGPLEKNGGYFKTTFPLKRERITSEGNYKEIIIRIILSSYLSCSLILQ